MDVTGEQLVQQARTWVGTPYHHAGRIKGPDGGVDCIGLIVGAARELGVSVPFDTTAYGRGDNWETLTAGLARFCNCLPDATAWEAGDILLLRGGPILHHIALYAGPETDTMIHVYNSLGRVAETSVAPEWRRLLARIYRLRGAGGDA